MSDYVSVSCTIYVNELLCSDVILTSAINEVLLTTPNNAVEITEYNMRILIGFFINDFEEH